ncbi:hypothetical protein NHX12_026718 [Muraenolepis orangiensis]|uniref:Uncharacterized protein n=1 Tax=Muraenolepis orangiensis TaxID=630683 RepID=A0A9Q0EKP9_9TELE|nr:hypothetical protein NHX12_026718 [Muraenolepis orangiensis]
MGPQPPGVSQGSRGSRGGDGVSGARGRAFSLGTRTPSTVDVDPRQAAPVRGLRASEESERRDAASIWCNGCLDARDNFLATIVEIQRE